MKKINKILRKKSKTNNDNSPKKTQEITTKFKRKY